MLRVDGRTVETRHSAGSPPPERRVAMRKKLHVLFGVWIVQS
jgi:hypothetical protein